MHCELCNIEFDEALWCRVINCPCTLHREPTTAQQKQFRWEYEGARAKEGAHAMKEIKEKHHV